MDTVRSASTSWMLNMSFVGDDELIQMDVVPIFLLISGVHMIMFFIIEGKILICHK